MNVTVRRPLPSWPFTATIVAYPLWWASGIGEYVVVVMAVPMVFLLMRRGQVRAPHGFGLLLFLLLWIALSASQLDAASRVIGFVYRYGIYVGLATFVIYLYNARSTLTVRRISGTSTVMLLWMTIGGIAGLLFPFWKLQTPMASIMPRFLLSNELVQEMVVRRLTQMNSDVYRPDLYSPRPSAPFLFANTWGNVYSLLVPLVILYLTTVPRRSWRFRAALALLVSSVVPAALTLNRGMFLGLAIGALYVFVRALLGRKLRIAGALVAAGLVAVTVVALLPVQERIDNRLQVSRSEDTRAALYAETWERSLEQPILGHGAPRPSRSDWLPSVGTQGQIWFTLFSHGFPAAVMLVGMLFSIWLAAFRAGTTAVALATGAIASASIVEILYYGFMPFGFLLVAIAAALTARERESRRRVVRAHPRATLKPTMAAGQ